MEPFVFLGENLSGDDEDGLYFQSFESYRQGIRFESASEEDSADFQVATPGNVNHIFEYERALDVLMKCALMRREIRT
jgi:hypothetical protein